MSLFGIEDPEEARRFDEALHKNLVDLHRTRREIDRPKIDSNRAPDSQPWHLKAGEKIVRADVAKLATSAEMAALNVHQHPANPQATPKELPPVLVDPLLILAAQTLDDLEHLRIATEGRLRSLRDVYGLAGSPQEAEALGLLDGLAALEHQATLSLKRALRRHPLGQWVKRTIGVGEKQGARLLAAIGDPYIRPELERPDGTIEPSRPRLVSELWAYCGYHVLRAGGDTGQSQRETQGWIAGVAPVRARGQKANWSADAKSRVWLIACSCIKKANSPYRAVYDDGRDKYADAVHQATCVRCGPRGHPAPIGSPLSAGHQHARALRLVSKAILRDLWTEARAIHAASP